MLSNLQDSVASKKGSYQASFAMVASLALAVAFALGAAVIQLSFYVGSVQAALIFAAGFLLLAIAMKITSWVQEKRAQRKMKAVKRDVGRSVKAAAATARVAASPALRPPLLVTAALIAAGYFFFKKADQADA